MPPARHAVRAVLDRQQNMALPQERKVRAEQFAACSSSTTPICGDPIARWGRSSPQTTGQSRDSTNWSTDFNDKSRTSNGKLLGGGRIKDYGRHERMREDIQFRCLFRLGRA